MDLVLVPSRYRLKCVEMGLREMRILKNWEILTVLHRVRHRHSILLRLRGQGVMFVEGRDRRLGRASICFRRFPLLRDRTIVLNRCFGR